MPICQPSSNGRGDAGVKMDLSGGGQVLDLETAVKDGVFDGGNGLNCVGVFVGKLNLNTMVEELESIDVPSVFICPISLEPMQDPVTLCTGQTYDRSNILKWFALGHCSCPTTMQELWDDSVTPNKTLHQVIYSWFSQKYLAMKKRSEDVQGRALELLETLKKVKGQARIQTLKEMKQVVTAYSPTRLTIAHNGGLSLISSLLGPFTSHAVGSEVIGILVNLDNNSELRSNLIQPARISVIVDVMNEGTLETKINCANLIQTLLEGNDTITDSVSSLSLLVGLLRLVKDRRYPNGVLTGLKLFKTICSQSQETIRSSVVSIGAVAHLIALLPSFNDDFSELVLCILDSLSTLPEGVQAMRDCPNFIPIFVKLLMKVSESCTEFSLSILWAVCKLAPEECASQAVEAGLATKLLLVIQSDCSPLLKQMSAELLKFCSLNYSASLFISKCKLTATMQ